MKTSHPEPLEASITEKKTNKAKYLTWNSITLTVVKKTSMPDSVKGLGCSNCYSSSSTKSVKSPSNSIRYNCLKICSWSRRPKTILKTRKKAPFLYVINNPIIYKFFKDFTNPRKNTNRAVVFSSWSFPKIFKYMDHQWHLPTTWKTRLSDTHWRFQLICTKVQAHSFLEPPLEYNQT